MSEGHTTLRTIDMVEQLLERDYTPEMIAATLQTSLRRAKALVSEVERRRAETK